MTIAGAPSSEPAGDLGAGGTGHDESGCHQRTMKLPGAVRVYRRPAYELPCRIAATEGHRNGGWHETLRPLQQRARPHSAPPLVAAVLLPRPQEGSPAQAATAQ